MQRVPISDLLNDAFFGADGFLGLQEIGEQDQ